MPLAEELVNQVLPKLRQGRSPPTRNAKRRLTHTVTEMPKPCLKRLRGPLFACACQAYADACRLTAFRVSRTAIRHN